MKKIIALLALAMTGILSFAQNVTLDSVCRELSKSKITAGNFTQEKFMNRNGRTLKSSGQYVFCDEGIMWKTEKPFPSTLVLSASRMIQISKNGQKTVTDTSTNETFRSIASTLTSVFSNDIERLKENFNVEFSSKNGTEWNAVLNPKDKTVAAVIESMVLKGTSSAGSAEITSIELNESSGDRISYTFTERYYPKELTSDEKALFKSE